MTRISLLAALLASTPALAAPPPALQTVLASPKFAAAKAALRADHERLVAEHIKLTEIPAPPFAETERGKAYAAMLRESGLKDVTTDTIGNVIGVRPGADRTLPPLVVAAHLDTVFPAGTDVKVLREGTKLFAPGVGDDTRGLAVLLAYVRALDKAGVRTQRDILFIGNVGEEGQGDLRGVRHLFAQDPRVTGAAGFISFDGDGAGAIVTRGVGSRRYRIHFDGPGGHSYGSFGIVNPMVPLGKTAAGLYTIPVPTEPKTTYSASVVSGGTSVNSIPAKLFLEVDIRSVAPAEVARVDAALHAIAAKAVAEENAARSTRAGKVTVTFEQIGDRPAGSSSEKAGLGPLAFAAAEAFGYKSRYVASSTDANVPMNLGIPAVTIGSGGNGEGAHSPQESFDTEIEESVKGMSVGLATVLAAAGLR